jgi:hypothetical protein
MVYLRSVLHARRTCEIFALLTEKIEAYQNYLENVRGQSVSGSSLNTEYVSVEDSVAMRSSRPARRYQQQNDMLPKVSFS